MEAKKKISDRESVCGLLEFTSYLLYLMDDIIVMRCIIIMLVLNLIKIRYDIAYLLIIAKLLIVLHKLSFT